MQLDWTTFTLEILNFLVLVWILKRFLYKPVMAAIAQRRLTIEQSLSEASATQEEARLLKQQYDRRLSDWENEKIQARRRMLEEISAERARLTAALQTALKQEREKQQVLEQRRALELQRTLEAQALAQGARFVARLLTRLASPELEAKIIGLVLEDLPHLSEEQRRAIHAACEAGMAITVTSAYPLSAEQCDTLAARLNECAGRDSPYTFSEDSSLLAGVRIGIGPWVMRANLQDELGFFIETLRETC